MLVYRVLMIDIDQAWSTCWTASINEVRYCSWHEHFTWFLIDATRKVLDTVLTFIYSSQISCDYSEVALAWSSSFNRINWRSRLQFGCLKVKSAWSCVSGNLTVASFPTGRLWTLAAPLLFCKISFTRATLEACDLLLWSSWFSCWGIGMFARCHRLVHSGTTRKNNTKRSEPPNDNGDSWPLVNILSIDINIDISFNDMICHCLPRFKTAR